MVLVVVDFVILEIVEFIGVQVVLLLDHWLGLLIG